MGVKIREMKNIVYQTPCSLTTLLLSLVFSRLIPVWTFATRTDDGLSYGGVSGYPSVIYIFCRLSFTLSILGVAIGSNFLRTAAYIDT